MNKQTRLLLLAIAIAGGLVGLAGIVVFLTGSSSPGASTDFAPYEKIALAHIAERFRSQGKPMPRVIRRGPHVSHAECLAIHREEMPAELPRALVEGSAPDAIIRLVLDGPESLEVRDRCYVVKDGKVSPVVEFSAFLTPSTAEHYRLMMRQR